MKKYIRAGVCLVYSQIRFIFKKIIHQKNFSYTAINLISPLTDVEIDKNGILSLGKGIKMRSGSKIRVRSGAEVFIGENSSFNHGCMLISHKKISVGKGVQFGPNVLIYDHDHDYKALNGLKNLKYKSSEVEIGDNVWIGANTVILRGTKLGNNCVVGAGSVVSGKYPDNTLIVSNREVTVKLL